jgi:hypothetical protein
MQQRVRAKVSSALCFGRPRHRFGTGSCVSQNRQFNRLFSDGPLP